MAGFAFKARDRTGTLVEGEVECPDRSSAILRIERLHGTPISVQPVTVKAPPPATPKRNGRRTREAAQAAPPRASAQPRTATKRTATSAKAAPEAPTDLETIRLSTKQQLFLTKQLAKLLKSGMTLEKALAALSERSSSPKLTALTAALHQDLTEGTRYSTALAKYPRIFSRIYVSLIAAGESSGSLPLILQRLAAYQEQNRKLMVSVQLALLYPALLSLVGFGVIVVFVTWVVPQLTGFLESTGSEMPLPTRMLIASYSFGMNWWWVLALLVLGAGLGFKSWTSSESGALAWDRLKLKLPLLGRLLTTRFSAQAAMTLGTLLAQGVLLSRALQLIKEIGGNRELAQRMDETIRQVEDGESLSRAAEAANLFPPMFLDMLQVGERSGELTEALQGIAEHYEEEVETQAQLVATLVPVVVILVIATVIGTVVVCIFMAVLNVASGLKRSMAGLENLFDLPWV
ncbi:MAG: type II secretion system F family protein [Verrucomicrobiota bacterium]